MREMIAAVYHGPNDLRLEKRPVPKMGPTEALLRVVSAGICATDLRILHGGHRKYPHGVQRIPGHEVVGDIVAVGAEVQSLAPGARVFVAPNMGCGHCRQCVAGHNNRCADYEAFGVTLDGAMAEYMRLPAAAIRQGNLISIESGVDPATATLIEPLACALRGQDPLDIQAEDVVLIVGAGPIGMMHLLLAQLRGARRLIVSDLVPQRLVQAKEAGADLVLNPSEEDLAEVVAAETSQEGADVVIVAAPSHRAMEEAISLAAPGGRISFFAGLPKDRTLIQCDANQVHYKELRVTGTSACSTSDCWRAASLVASGHLDIGRLVSARFPLSQANQAFALAEDRQSLKVVLEPGT